MIFSHVFVVLMHTYHKVTTNSFEKNLTWPNHASPCLGFRKLFNMLLSRIGWEAFDQQWGIWTDFYQNRCIFFSQWSREGARTPPLVSKYLWKYVIKNRPNCTPVYRRWWYPVGLQAKSNILNLWTWSSLNLFRKFGLAHSQKMDDITYCRNMHNLVWFLITDSGGFRFGLIWFLSLSFGENLECIFTLGHDVTQTSMKSMLMHSCRFIVNDAFCNSNAFYAFLIFFEIIIQ